MLLNANSELFFGYEIKAYISLDPAPLLVVKVPVIGHETQTPTRDQGEVHKIKEDGRQDCAFSIFWSGCWWWKVNEKGLDGLRCK